MADHDGGSGQGGGGGGGPMVVDTQAVGTGPGAAAQLPGQRTAAPVQRYSDPIPRQRPHPLGCSDAVLRHFCDRTDSSDGRHYTSTLLWADRRALSLSSPG